MKWCGSVLALVGGKDRRFLALALATARHFGSTEAAVSLCGRVTQQDFCGVSKVLKGCKKFDLQASSSVWFNSKMYRFYCVAKCDQILPTTPKNPQKQIITPLAWAGKMTHAHTHATTPTHRKKITLKQINNPDKYTNQTQITKQI